LIKRFCKTTQTAFLYEIGETAFTQLEQREMSKIRFRVSFDVHCSLTKCRSATLSCVTTLICTKIPTYMHV
jgi:hypothetical protein